MVPPSPTVPVVPEIVPSKPNSSDVDGSSSSATKSSDGKHRVRSGSSDESIPLVMFQDINRDGMMDLVFGF